MKIHFSKSILGAVTAIVLCFMLGSCSADESQDDSQAVTRNADGSLTIRSLTSVALPGGFTQATITGASSSKAVTRVVQPPTSTLTTGEAIENKTSWSVGDRLHITYYNHTASTSIYRYATLQSDGKTWLLNDAFTVPNVDGLDISYLGTNYNQVDFNDENTGVTGKDINNNDFVNTTTRKRLYNVESAIYYLRHDGNTEGTSRFYDVLSANNNASCGEIIAAEDGTLSVAMGHYANKLAITSVDVSAFGEGVTVASVIANDAHADYGDIKLEMLPASGSDQPSEAMPWYAILPRQYQNITSFTVTLSDGRQITAILPDLNKNNGKHGLVVNDPDNLYAYHLTLGPGSVTVTPDNTFTAPGWNAGTVTY